MNDVGPAIGDIGALDAVAEFALGEPGRQRVAQASHATIAEPGANAQPADLLHGYGGGYFPPILGSKSRPAGPIPEEPFEAGMTVVIQPNVVTRDGKAGVQTGEFVLITATGIERLHAFPRGLIRVG